MNRNAPHCHLPLTPPFHLPLSLPLHLPLSLFLMAMLGLTSLTAPAAGFYRFEQWSAPAGGTPAQTPNPATYYWYQPMQPLTGNHYGYQPLPSQTGNYYFWYQPFQPLTGNYYYWYQPQQPLTGNAPGQTFNWYQFGQPVAPQPAHPQVPRLSPQSLQAPYYWYWFQPYY